MDILLPLSIAVGAIIAVLAFFLVLALSTFGPTRCCWFHLALLASRARPRLSTGEIVAEAVQATLDPT